MQPTADMLLTAYRYWPQKSSFLFDKDSSVYWTMFVIETGSFHYEIGEHSGEAGSWDVVICPPGVLFHRSTITPLTFHFIQFQWSVNLADDAVNKRIGQIKIADRARLISSCRYLRSIGEEAAQDENMLKRIEHYLKDIWLLIEEEVVRMPELEPQSSDPLMVTARTWLKERAYEPLYVRDLSKLLGITPVQLTRRFLAAYQTTPSSFVIELRIARATKLLEETTLTMEAIAIRCGYENGFYLSRVFRERKGMTASAYRKLHQI